MTASGNSDRMGPVVWDLLGANDWDRFTRQDWNHGLIRVDDWDVFRLECLVFDLRAKGLETDLHDGVLHVQVG